MCFCSIHLHTAADVTLRCAETSLTYWLLSFAPSVEPAPSRHPKTRASTRPAAPQQGRSPPPRPPLTHTGTSSITQMRAFLARRPTSPSSYSTATTLPLCGRIDYSQPAKISTVKAPITAKEPVGDDQGMCADQKIGHDTVARTSTCSVPAPGLRRFNRRLFRHRREGSGQLVHRVPKTSSIAKHCCSLCPDHL